MATDTISRKASRPVQGEAALRTSQIPANIEKLLYLAAGDRDLEQALLRDREAAASRAGLALSPSELALLRAASAEQLAGTIRSLDLSPGNLQRRTFMKAVAVSAATLAAAGAAAGCSDDTDKPKLDGKVPDAGKKDAAPKDTGVKPDAALTDSTSKPDAAVGVDLPKADFPMATGIRPGG